MLRDLNFTLSVMMNDAAPRRDASCGGISDIKNLITLPHRRVNQESH